MYGYIYLIINKVNGKTYVGKRKTSKIWFEDKYMGSGKKLASAKKHYGIENFEKFLICYTESEKDACEKEKFWIAEYRSRGKAEYNILEGGQGGGHPSAWKGKHLSEEHKNKISKKLKGKPSNSKGKARSEEARNKMSKSAKNRPSNRKGAKLSSETKIKMSEAKKAYWAKQRGDNLCA